jgi:c-di-GMP-binding flagellar brake protein YcgR
MQLPLREFADVITALKGPGDRAGPSEKRRAARMTVTARVTLHLVDNNRVVRSFSAITRDISITGMGLLQSVALSMNQNVVLALPRPHSPPLFVVSTVVACRPLADGLVTVGLEFAEMASKETVDILMDDGSREKARIQESVLR